MKNYVKLQVGYIVYYFRIEVFNSEPSITTNSHERLLLADFAINKWDNSFVKCRAPIEDVLDSYANIYENSQ